MKKHFDIVMIDINLGDISEESGLVLARSILTELPKSKILILTGFDLPVYRYEAEKIGVKGFANKNIDPSQLVRMLGRIHNGDTLKVGSEYIETLTDAEKAILQLLADGVKRKDISERLT
jgi:two-component system secretion system response regulator SalR